MEKVVIRCIDNGKTQTADILSKTDKHMKVVFDGTNTSLELHRTDLNKPYMGRFAGLEFEYNPEVG
jgi:hypothetical protein